MGVEEKQETSAFFFHYISRRADSDQEMSVSDANLIKEQREEAVQALNDGAAIRVASKLADLGDQIDARYQSQMEEIIELTGSPETAYTTFLYVVENLFNWDENGRAMINLGRIAALMAYCYQLCKTYIMREMASTSLIVNFMGLVAGWLFKFLLKAKFYDWLRSQGGWGQLVLSATHGVGRYGASVLVIGGVALFALLAYSYWRRK